MVKIMVGVGLKSVPKYSEEVGSSVDEFLPFVIKTRQLKTVTWPSTTPTTDNKTGSAREGLISPSIVRSCELELAGRLMLYSKDVWTSAL